MTSPTKDTVWKVRNRDHDSCARCGQLLRGERGTGWSIHHRRPRGAGGTRIGWVNLPANLILLCGSGTTGCHGWVEAHRDRARHDGFLVPLNGIRTAEDIPLEHHRFGLVYLTNDGGHLAA